jgi:transcriptional regulator with XRE-family HTH domain
MSNQTIRKTSIEAKTEKPVKKAENWAEFEFDYIGDRIKEARTTTGITRIEMASIMGLSIAQYSNFERTSSSSLRNVCAIINYFAVIHGINPSWIFLKDNSTIPFKLNDQRLLTIDSMIAELNKQVAPHGMMVNLVSKA